MLADRLSLALGLLCAVLIVTLRSPLMGVERIIPVPETVLNEAAITPPKPPPFEPPPIAMFVEVNGKLLFHPSREAMEPIIEDKTPPPPAPQVSFIGLIATGDERLAMVKGPRAPQAFTLRVGTMIEGWKVANILNDRIVLNAKKAQHEIRINAASAPRPAQTAPANRPPANAAAGRGPATRTPTRRAQAGR
jgi:hypothetical protein